MTRPGKAAAQGGGSADLYEIRRKIYPRAVTGLFARWRWATVWVTQLVFYGLPWLSWNDRPAILFDLINRRFYLFGVVLYPQDFIYLTALLVISALALFLFTAVAGRLWCGYACPQTVYTEIFMWIERKVEGDRPARMRLDREAPGLRKLRIKATKHALWLAIALWTGVTFVGYFTPIDVLLAKIAAFGLGPWETFWILFYGFATWGNAGFMREQVCIYMCPYARFQSAMFDRDTMIITYDGARGEPRGPRPRKTDPKVLGLGDCVNCGLCVEVCPTGIDIRDGLQYQCIGCAACVDACDKVMDRVGYPKGLIRYDTENGLAGGWSRAQLFRRVRRPRVLVYSAILLALTVALFVHLALRTPLKVDVIRDRGTLGREVENGQIENVYRLMLINGAETPRTLRITVGGIDSIAVASDSQVTVGAAEAHAIAVRVRIARDHRARPGMNAIEFTVTAADDDSVSVREKSTFYVPR
ncbi:MAG: cytochrome c oxidase accessory protein CcoG [Burkholderiaceae bacterium]|nr:cytochrome c oxidase accessory protein CcoG [Burkholderiaceae bacterium]